MTRLPDETVVAALYIDPRGPYPKMAGVDCWDESRDARLYSGPWPVVAHPPCQVWTNLAAVNFKRYGGEHNRPGNDGLKFARALEQVQRYGGVLEHPAESRAWAAHGLVRPCGIGWSREGETGKDLWPPARWWVCEVWQSAYGHKARKRTWLYYAGKTKPAELNWTRAPGTHQCGWFDRNKPTLGKLEASRTPQAFAETLIGLARRSRQEPA